VEALRAKMDSNRARFLLYPMTARYAHIHTFMKPRWMRARWAAKKAQREAEREGTAQIERRKLTAKRSSSK